MKKIIRNPNTAISLTLCLIIMFLAVALFPLQAQSLQIITTAQNCGTIYLGKPFSCQFVAVGGVPPYHWTASALLPGLTLSDSGLLSGTVVQCSATVVSNCVNLPIGPQGLKVLVAGQTLTLKAEKVKKTSRRRHA